MDEQLDNLSELHEELDRQIGTAEDEISNARSTLEDSESELYDAKRNLGRLNESIDRMKTEFGRGNNSNKKEMLDFLKLIVNIDEYGSAAYHHGKYVPRTEWGKPIADVEKLAAELYEDLRDA